MRKLLFTTTVLCALAGSAFGQSQSIPRAASTANLGSLASQSASSVAITGGTIDGAAIGQTTPVAAGLTTLTLTGAGLTPPLEAYPSNWFTTNELQYGNTTFLKNFGYGWGTAGTQLCLIQGYPIGTAPAACGVNGVVGQNGPVQWATYSSLDSVQYLSVITDQPPQISAAGTFSSTRFMPNPSLTAPQVAQLFVNESVETNGSVVGASEEWRSYITDWDLGGTWVQVAGWYQPGNTAANQVPTDGALNIGVDDRIWAQNPVVTLPYNGNALQMTGAEYDMDNNRVQPVNDLSAMGVFIAGNNKVVPIYTFAGTFGATDFFPTTPLTSLQLSSITAGDVLFTSRVSGATAWKATVISATSTDITVNNWTTSLNTAAGQVPSGVTGVDLHLAGAPLNYDLGAGVLTQGGMIDGIESRSGHNALFLANPDNLTGSYNAGFLSYQSTGYGFQQFTGSTGTTFRTQATTGDIDLGAFGSATSASGTPTISFHSAGNNAGAATSVPTGEISVSGGTPGTDDTGSMLLHAGTLTLQGTGNVTVQGSTINLNSPVVANNVVTAPAVKRVPTTTAALETAYPCIAGNQGLFAAVTDATTPSFLAVLVGGGTIYAPVTCNGSNWITY